MRVMMMMMMILSRPLQRPPRLRLLPRLRLARPAAHVRGSPMKEFAGILRHKINPVMTCALTLAGSIRVRYHSGPDALRRNVIRLQLPSAPMCTMASAMGLIRILIRIAAGITAVLPRWGSGSEPICVTRCLRILPGATKDHVLSARVTIDRIPELFNHEVTRRNAKEEKTWVL